MSASNFLSADDLLSAYYASLGESPPSLAATRWLQTYLLRRGQTSTDSLEYGFEILNRAIIDVEDVAENFLGLDLYIDDLQRFDEKAGAPVFGFASPETGRITICRRAEAYAPLYRSTVMHEVAHMILHGGPKMRTLCYSPSSRNRPPEEREADWFMAQALLPKSILYLAVVLAGRARGLFEGEAFRAANTRRGQFQWRNVYFPFFVNRLCLSRQLVAVRMSQERKFNDATYKYHLRYTMPNRWWNEPPQPFASAIKLAIPTGH
jgi:IrrE N-terminal-like domain